jgi:surface polysaccharide O-acyltransferase-like enzyme
VLRALAGLRYVLACFASCFFVFAVAIRFGGIRATLLDSVKANAFGMYLVHYLFIVWLQFALLGLALPAVVKAAIVFSLTLALSWSATAALRRVPVVGPVLGADRRSIARPAPPRALPAE